MKVLLVGEYNRVHKNLKEGLEQLGHQAKVVGLRDGFKKVDVDIELKDYFENGILKKLRVLGVKLFRYDILGTSLKYQIKNKREHLSNYDIVQFINEAPFLCDRKIQFQLIKDIISWNKNVFLLSCGTDYPSVSYAFDKKFKYSILTPYFEGKGKKKDFSPALSYLTPVHKTIYNYLYEHITGVIANDLDYHLPLLGHTKYLGMIPHAIDLSKLPYKTPDLKDKIIIFHGVNKNNYFKKGNDLFDKAIALIAKDYRDRIEIIRTENLAYKDYIQAFDKCHILLDQVYAYDQGFNALEAMAKGKVVFTGAETEWLEYYHIKEDSTAINAMPSEELIAKKLSWLIDNPEKIMEISKNARVFVEKYHDHINCTKAYLEKWQKALEA